jgi:hypothetical protein
MFAGACCWSLSIQSVLIIWLYWFIPYLFIGLSRVRSSDHAELLIARTPQGDGLGFPRRHPQLVYGYACLNEIGSEAVVPDVCK